MSFVSLRMFFIPNMLVCCSPTRLTVLANVDGRQENKKSTKFSIILLLAFCFQCVTNCNGCI